MKTKIYITLAILVIAVSAKAQSDAISTYFSEYLEDESITQISMGSKAFEMIGGFSAQSESGNAFEKLSSQIDGLKMVVLHDLENSRTTALAACQKVRNRFEDLITVTDKDAYVNVMI
ncbi:MAG TPA: DUF4252 domain-containing protein, partial [Cryomorphaceae bacterium]|nr:DUF4252 domain-containing protein [Cryomorphaceae bacterium]